MRKRPFVPRNFAHQLLLHFQHAVLFIGQLQALGYPLYMRVDRDRRHAERIGDDDIRRLAPDTGKLG